MSDDDLIRRGDARDAVRLCEFRWQAEDAIAALPAVTVGAYTRTGVMNKDGREICVGDRIMIDLTSGATKREYWRPEYEVVFNPPCFTLKHVGGDKDSDTARFQWNVPQRSSTERITTLRVAAPDPAHRPTMTDMMVDPDTLDAFMEANPLPDEPDARLRASVAQLDAMTPEVQALVDAIESIRDYGMIITSQKQHKALADALAALRAGETE